MQTPVQRKRKVSKQKSVADAISLLAEAQMKSDEMFVKLEAKRMEFDVESVERRERMKMELEERRMQTQQQFELKRLEMVMGGGRRSSPVGNPARPATPQQHHHQSAFHQMPSTSGHHMPPASRYPQSNDGNNQQDFDQGDAYNIGDSIRMSMKVDM